MNIVVKAHGSGEPARDLAKVVRRLRRDLQDGLGRKGRSVPPIRIPVTVDSEQAMADVFIDMDVPTTATLPEAPDPQWTYTDAAGHFHAFNAKGEPPTLDAEAVYVPEGDTEVQRYYCKVCREQVIPAMLPGPVEVVVSVRRTWCIRTILANLPARDRVTVHGQPANSPVVFGIASVSRVSGDGPYEVELIGEGPLARMKAA